MHLIQILLPLFDNDGSPLAQEHFQQLSSELTQRFGGLTAYTREPAVGMWKGKTSQVKRDEIVIFEIQSDELDRSWWRAMKHCLESRFRQDQVIVRFQQIELL